VVKSATEQGWGHFDKSAGDVTDVRGTGIAFLEGTLQSDFITN
jgi:hypothetical protein